MKTYQDYLDKLKGLVKNVDNVLTDPDDYDSALEIATDTYGRYRPLEKTVLYTQSVASNRIFLLPTDWDNEFSINRFRIELPVDVTAPQDTFLDANMIEIYLDSADSVWKLRFRSTLNADFTPAINTTFNLKYQVPHVLDEGLNTIPDSHFWPVVFCAAASACDMKASFYTSMASANVDGSSQADYGSKSKTMADVGKQYYSRFAAAIIPPDEEQQPSAVFGVMTENPLHHAPYTLWPRDTDNRKQVYN